MKIEEVAVRIGVSVQTINRWYKFKKQHPDSELSKQLPEYTKVKKPCTYGYVRNWSEDDLYKLIQFRTHINTGRNGKLGKYGGKGTKNGKNEN